MKEAKTLRRMLKAVLVFNLIDAVMTLLLVTCGEATEANPVMDACLSISPVAFMAAKLALVSVGVLVLWSNLTKKVASVGAVTIFMVYVAIMVIHVESARILVERLV